MLASKLIDLLFQCHQFGLCLFLQFHRVSCYVDFTCLPDLLDPGFKRSQVPPGLISHRCQPIDLG